MKTSVLVIVLSSLSLAQDFTPSSAQHSSLVKQRETLVKLSNEISKLQAELAFKSALMDESCRKIVLQNHWPINVQCEKNSLMFMIPSAQQSTPRGPSAIEMYKQKQEEESTKPK